MKTAVGFFLVAIAGGILLLNPLPGLEEYARNIVAPPCNIDKVLDEAGVVGINVASKGQLGGFVSGVRVKLHVAQPVKVPKGAFIRKYDDFGNYTRFNSEAGETTPWIDNFAIVYGRC